MAQDYYTILTNAGLAYEAQQKAQNKPITLVAMAIGDGNGAAYNPDPAATTLRSEVHRQPINSLLQDANNPTWLVAEAWLADDVGGWTIREVGIYTDTGVLYAIAKYPESIKPLLASGSGKQFYVRTIFQTSNVASVVLQVDNSVVMATRAFVVDYVRDELAKLDSKQSVRVATTANIALTGLQTIDGVVLVAGDRVLVKDQAAAKDNGIYVAAVGVWSRAADADSAAKLNAGASVPVAEGTLSADTLWTLRTDGVIVIGTTALAWQWMAGANAPDQAAGDNSRKVANTAFVTRAVAAVTGGHMFEISQWMGTRNAMPEGWFSMDGAQISELLVPGIREALAASGQSVVTEADWQADPLKRGSWSSGAAGWVRMPDWNGVQAGSIGGLHFGGDLGGGRRSAVVGDAIRNITGSVGNIVFNSSTYATGAFGGTSDVVNTLALTNTGSSSVRQFTFDASTIVPTAEENRPKTVYGTWIMRLYGSITNVGSLDAPALVASVNALKSRVEVLEAQMARLPLDTDWVDKTALRAFNTTFTNPYPFDLEISVVYASVVAGVFQIEGLVNGSRLALVNSYASTASTGDTLCMTVGPSKSYRLQNPSNCTLYKWSEKVKVG